LHIFARGINSPKGVVPLFPIIVEVLAGLVTIIFLGAMPLVLRIHAFSRLQVGIEWHLSSGITPQEKDTTYVFLYHSIH